MAKLSHLLFLALFIAIAAKNQISAQPTDTTSLDQEEDEMMSMETMDNAEADAVVELTDEEFEMVNKTKNAGDVLENMGMKVEKVLDVEGGEEDSSDSTMEEDSTMEDEDDEETNPQKRSFGLGLGGVGLGGVGLGGVGLGKGIGYGGVGVGLGGIGIGKGVGLGGIGIGKGVGVGYGKGVAVASKPLVQTSFRRKFIPYVRYKVVNEPRVVAIHGRREIIQPIQRRVQTVVQHQVGAPVVADKTVGITKGQGAPGYHLPVKQLNFVGQAGYGGFH